VAQHCVQIICIAQLHHVFMPTSRRALDVLSSLVCTPDCMLDTRCDTVLVGIHRWDHSHSHSHSHSYSDPSPFRLLPCTVRLLPWCRPLPVVLTTIQCTTAASASSGPHAWRCWQQQTAAAAAAAALMVVVLRLVKPSPSTGMVSLRRPATGEARWSAEQHSLTVTGAHSSGVCEGRHRSYATYTHIPCNCVALEVIGCITSGATQQHWMFRVGVIDASSLGGTNSVHDVFDACTLYALPSCRLVVRVGFTAQRPCSRT